MSSDQDNPTPPPIPQLPPILSAPASQFNSQYPMPPLPYSSPVYHGRPGILTAVSVLSIIIACLSAGGSLMSGCMSVGLYNMAGGLRNSSAFTATTVSPPATVQGTNGTSVPDTMPALVAGINGLASEDREVAIAALGEMQAISDPRKEQLETFLAQHGQIVFPTAGRRLTAAQIKISVSSSQTVAPTGDDNGAISFVTQWGTLNVDDDQATYFRASAPAPLTTKAHDDSAATTTTNSFGFGPLSPAQVQSAVAAAITSSGNKLNAAQIATLTAQLQNPQQEFLLVKKNAMPVQMVAVQADGSASVQFASGSMITMDSAGVVTSTFSPQAFSKSILTNGLGISRTTLALLSVEALMSLALSALLLIGGIMVLRESTLARRIHYVYAIFKIPTAILFGAAGSWLSVQFSNAISPAIPGGGGNAIVGVYTTMALVIAVAACIYPIALIFVFRAKQVRAYYSSTNSY